jgi:hypothetical protein
MGTGGQVAAVAGAASFCCKLQSQYRIAVPVLTDMDNGYASLNLAI